MIICDLKYIWCKNDELLFSFKKGSKLPSGVVVEELGCGTIVVLCIVPSVWQIHSTQTKENATLEQLLN